MIIYSFLSLITFWIALLIVNFLVSAHVLSHDKYYNLLEINFTVLNAFVVVMLLGLGIALLFQMYSKYYFAFQDQRGQLISFLFTEVIGQVIICIANIYYALG